MTPQSVIETRTTEQRRRSTGEGSRIIETKVLRDGPGGSVEVDVLVRMEEPLAEAAKVGLSGSVRNEDMADYSVAIAQWVAELRHRLVNVYGLRDYMVFIDAEFKGGNGGWK
jgi:hypothetical protein